jgi:hypothetical protein
MSPGAWRVVRWAVVLPVTLAAGLASVVAAQHQLDTSPQKTSGESLLYLPAKKLLMHFTGGMNSVVADLLWLKTIQYTVAEFESRERRFTWLEHMAQTATDLDPLFTGAYEYGGTFLGAIGNDDAADRLLRKGMMNRPDRHEIPFEMAKLYILNRREEPGAAGVASYYLGITAELSDTPDYYLTWAFNLQRAHNLTETGRRIWQNIFETTGDSFMRDLAEQKLHHLNLADACDTLDEVASQYASERGSPPASVEDLVKAGYLKAIPNDPLGGSFFFDSNGRARSTSILDEQANRARRDIQAAIDRFREERGRKPVSLQELLDEEIIRYMPDHPYEDRTWSYDPNLGEVR